jgi:protein tyrosine/serine phosphatase
MTTNRRSHGRAVLSLALALLFLSSPFAAEKVRPAEWAVPVRLEGVPNLHRIAPDLYRSGQPTLEGFENLKTLGIRTVVNLRGGDDDARASIEVGFRPEHVALSALRIRPSANVRILRVLAEPGRGPTLFHCRRGAERAGMICALYRMVFQGWDRDKAIEEMRKGGYGFRWYYRGLINYLRDVDVDALRKELGIAAAPAVGAAR